MLAALDDMGGTGIVYGDDIGQGVNLPTAPVISLGHPGRARLAVPPCLPPSFLR